MYTNSVARELLEVELNDDAYKFKMQALVTNPNYTNKRMMMLLFINNRLVDSSCKFNHACINIFFKFLYEIFMFNVSAIRKMLEEIYSVYLPKKAHPWCYISLDINPQNIDVNVHPTKHEVRFLHEDAIIERMKFALDERLAGNSASRTFYLQARLPKVDITKEVLEEVLPEYNKENPDKSKKVYAKEMIRTDSSDQKLDKFNFTIHTPCKHDSNTFTEKSTHNAESESLNIETPLEENISHITVENLSINKCEQKDSNLNITEHNFTSSKREIHIEETPVNNSIHWSDVSDIRTINSSEQNTYHPSTSAQKDKSDNIRSENITYDVAEFLNDLDETTDESIEDDSRDIIAEKARKQVYQYFGNKDIIDDRKKNLEKDKEETKLQNIDDNKKEDESSISNTNQPESIASIEKPVSADESPKSTSQFKSYSVNNFRHEVKLTSILKLRKEVEDECHEGLRNILTNLTFIGCIDQTSALIQSGMNLYICNTKKLA